MLQFQILLTPVFALMGLAFLFNVVLRNFRDGRHEQIAFGVLFGAVVVLGMTNPLLLGEGLIFDTRTLLVGSAVAFVGPLAGFIALMAGLICRIVIGGAGTVSGLVGLLLAYGIALAWTLLVSDRVANRILNDFLFGLFITSSAVALFLLPFDVAMNLFASVTPKLLLINSVGTVIIGLVLRRELQHFENNKALETYAKTDSLTNLLNRRGMDAEFSAAKFNRKTGHAMFHFDVDDFKRINDTYGHAAGDATLAIVAARINESIRDEAIFTRHGGDEFSLYLPQLDASDVQALADRLCTVIGNQPFNYKHETFGVSISVGAFWSREDIPAQAMIDKADAQLLLAKQAGKGRAQVAYGERSVSSAVA